MAGTSDYNVPLLYTPYSYHLVMEADDGELYYHHTRMPCLIYEGIALTYLPYDQVPPFHLLGYRHLFRLTADNVLWCGHTAINLNRLICGMVDIADDAPHYDQHRTRIGADDTLIDQGVNIHWVMKGRLLSGKSIAMPFFGWFDEQCLASDPATIGWGSFIFPFGNVFQQLKFSSMVFSNVPEATFYALRSQPTPPTDEALGD